MKRGFTLIELLAVIVILAIIALIVTPLILNIINDSRKESLARSAENYIIAVEQSIESSLLKDPKRKTNGEYEILENGKKISNGEYEYQVKYDGIGISEGTITINDLNVVALTDCIISNKSVTMDEKGKITIGDTGNPTPEPEPEPIVYNDGDEIYFNVDTGKKCTDYTTSQSTIGVNKGCMKFYAFNDEEGKDTVNLILDHNTTAKIIWVNQTDYLSAVGTSGSYGTYGNNNKGPITVWKQLKSDTDSWVGTEPQENYTNKSKGYTIDYSGYKARLITAQEIATITNNTNWKEETANSNYYLDSNSSVQKASSTVPSKFYWIFDHTYNCTAYGCKVPDNNTYGYWTASAHYSYTNRAWSLGSNGDMLYDHLTWLGRGIRPVITVSKNKLK